MRFTLIHPLITEKATRLGARGEYVFLVDDAATKPEVRKSVEKTYKVTVVKVNIVNAKPKVRRLGRSIGTKPGYKKAIVRLAAGQKLDIIPH